MNKYIKYKNRKLYCTQDKVYITIPEVADIVKRGLNISVLDHRTKNDCTQDVLIQCLAHINNNTMDPARIVALIRGEQ